MNDENPNHQPKTTLSSLTAARNRSRFEEAERATGHQDFVKNARICSDYYAGEQWDPEVKAQLEREKRPALTLNMFLSTINAVIGEQLERKVEVKYTAARNGSEKTAFALNTITKAILNENNFTEVEESVFADGVITDRGFYDIRMSFENNIMGEVRITSEDAIDIIIDPEAKESDPATWNEVFISRWMTPDEIAVTYGDDKRKDVLARAAYGETGRKHYEFESPTFGNDTYYTHEDEQDTAALRRIRVIERQFYEYTTVLKYVDLDTGDMRQVPHGVEEEEAKAFAEENGLGLFRTKGRRVKMHVSAGDVMLYDDWSIYRSFTIVPFFPYFRRGKPHGLGRHILDPQDLLNKTSSQELHIVNTTANSGWKVQENSLVDMEPEDLEERGSQTGLVITYKRGYEAPEKIQPNQIPTGIERISQKAAVTIREVSAVNASMLGTARADQSGRAQEAAISRGQVQVSVVLASLRRSRRLVAKKVLELVQDFYTETRYFRTTDEGVVTTTDPNEATGINMVDDDGNILNDVSVGEYGITVGHAPAGSNAMEVEFNEALRMRDLGVAIPDHFVVKYSSLTERNEVAEFLKQQNGYGEITPEQQQMQQAQHEFQLQSMQKQLETMDAEIDAKMAKAQLDMANAGSKEGYREAEMELLKLQQQRAMSRQDALLRIALAARGHVNQQNMNESRLATQVAMQSMQQIAQREQAQITQQKTGDK